MTHQVCRGCTNLQPNGSCGRGLDQEVPVCPGYQSQEEKPERRVAIAVDVLQIMLRMPQKAA